MEEKKRPIGRPKLDREEYKGTRIYVRVTNEEHEKILKLAAQDERSVTSWVRQLVLKAINS